MSKCNSVFNSALRAGTLVPGVLSKFKKLTCLKKKIIHPQLIDFYSSNSNSFLINK